MLHALCLPQSAIQNPFSTLAKVSAIFAAVKLQHSQFLHRMSLARIFHELPAATTDVGVLPGVLVCRSLQRTVEVRLGTNPAVPRDGCQVARPSSRSRDNNS